MWFGLSGAQSGKKEVTKTAEELLKEGLMEGAVGWPPGVGADGEVI